MMDIKMIFHGTSIAKQIAGYLGIIETMDAKLDRLAGSEFEGAIRSLKQAATSQSERNSLLREARSRFNKAISLENNERLALSYIGLALCHFQLGDDYNGREALRAVNFIKLVEGVAEKLKAGGEAVVIAAVLGPMLGAKEIATVVAAHYYGVSRRKKFRELQDSVQRFLETES